MNAGRIVATSLGVILIAALMTLFPAEYRASASAGLYLVAAFILLLVAAALIVRPARSIEARLFGLALEPRGRFLGLPPERDVRTVLSPLIVAGVCFAVALVSGFLRS